jgi:hypothetical protein
MKKILIIAITSLMLFSCKKDISIRETTTTTEVKPEPVVLEKDTTVSSTFTDSVVTDSIVFIKDTIFNVYRQDNPNQKVMEIYNIYARVYFTNPYTNKDTTGGKKILYWIDLEIPTTMSKSYTLKKDYPNSSTVFIKYTITKYYKSLADFKLDIYDEESVKIKFDRYYLSFDYYDKMLTPTFSHIPY